MCVQCVYMCVVYVMCACVLCVCIYIYYVACACVCGAQGTLKEEEAHRGRGRG